MPEILKSFSLSENENVFCWHYFFPVQSAGHIWRDIMTSSLTHKLSSSILFILYGCLIYLNVTVPLVSCKEFVSSFFESHQGGRENWFKLKNYKPMEIASQCQFCINFFNHQVIFLLLLFWRAILKWNADSKTFQLK